MLYERFAQRTLDATMNRKDLAAVMRPWADDAVFEFPGRTPISGRYEGKAAIEGLFRRMFERMEVMRFTVRRVGMANPVGFTYNNTIFMEMELDETTKDGVTIHTNVITEFEYRHGKVVAARDWIFDPTIVEAVWGHADVPVPA